MPSFSNISLVLFGLLASSFAFVSQSTVSRRKTIGFNPVHPHDDFHTGTFPIPSAKGFSSSSDPYEVAKGFVTALLSDQLSGVNSFAMRNDSYTNKANGVTHVFFRQMINGIEVADGDINVNVKDGAVISYGDSVSFVVGSLPLAARLLYRSSFTVAMRPASSSLMS